LDPGIPQAESRGRGYARVFNSHHLLSCVHQTRRGSPSQTIESSGPQPAHRHAGYRRKAARNSLKTALELARTFPFGVLASQACPYCYDSGCSSPGTRCSYFRGGKGWDRRGIV